MVYQTDGAGNKLATFTYDANGVPESVVIGSGTTTPRYYYVSNGHGDVVALVDSVGTVVASYSYDAFGNLTESLESLPNGWSNPYRYDGAEGVRYDSETGLYWLSVRAYDPTLGRFISHDPLGRLAAMGLDMRPYVYVGNNPVNYTDPTGLLCNPQADMCLWRQYFQARQQAQQQGTPAPTPPDEHHGSYCNLPRGIARSPQSCATTRIRPTFAAKLAVRTALVRFSATPSAPRWSALRVSMRQSLVAIWLMRTGASAFDHIDMKGLPKNRKIGPFCTSGRGIDGESSRGKAIVPISRKRQTFLATSS